MKDSPSFKITKKRSLSQLPRRTLSTAFQFPKPTFPSLSQTQLFNPPPSQQLSTPLKDKHLLLKQLTDQKGQNQGLRKSIQQAMQKVKLERRQSYLVKDQLFVVNEDRNRYEKEYKEMGEKYYELVGKYHIMGEGLEKQRIERQQAQRELREIKSKLGSDLEAVESQLNTLRGDNEKLSQIARDEGLAVQRIKTLEFQLRQLKLNKSHFQQTIKRLTQQIREYQAIADSVKPQLERQTERVKYYERLVGDLQKKVDGYYQREYELQREVEKREKQVAKWVKESEGWKRLYEVEDGKCKVKVVELKEKEEKLEKVEVQLQQLVIKHEQKVIDNTHLTQKLLVLQQTLTLKSNQLTHHISRIAFLESHQLSLHTALQQAKLTFLQSLRFVSKRDLQAYKLKQDKQYLQLKIDQLVQRYKKFDEYYMESSVVSKNKLKDSVVAYVKSCSKIEVDMSQLRKGMEMREREMSEERQYLRREIEGRGIKLIGEENEHKEGLYQSIWKEKNEQIRVLELTNAQLYRSTSGYSDIITTLQEQNTRYEFQINTLKRNIEELLKLEKENIQLRMKEKQQQLTINELRREQKQLDERLIRKAEELSGVNEKMGGLEKEISKLLQEIDVLQIRVNMKSPLKEITVQKPTPSNEDLQRSLSLELKQKSMIQAIQKMNNALQSINIYFACGYCDKLVKQPYTVLPCGHNYCQECRQGFGQDCFECSNGMPVQMVFKNVNLESALTRLQFFNMVFENVAKMFGKGKGEKEGK